MYVLVLGPVVVSVDGKAHSLPRSQTRGVLALLALDAGRALSRQAIMDALWGGAPPPTGRAQIHNALRQIRGLLADLGVPGSIESGSFGYRLAVEPTLVDAVRFEQLARQGRKASANGDHGEASRLLRAALDLWTGEPLLDAGGAFVEAARTRLNDGRLTAIEDLADIDLIHGRPELVAAELGQLVHAYPLRERLRSRLMLALYRSGRRADALRVCREYRQILAEQEGLDPGPDLVELERLILRGDSALTVAAATAPVASDPTADEPRLARRRDAPAQLPPDLRGFVGRSDDLRRLDEILDDAQTQPSATVCVITGTAGVGKTSLAVHWAHRIRDSFPDGQLYVNLRGFDPDGVAMAPAEAIHRFLDALGVPPERVPTDLDAQASLYRSELDGRRMLILLDNARNSSQVRPLLPGTANALTIVTSRSQMSSLVAVNAAQPLALAEFTGDEARQLLAHRLGPGRVAAEPAAVERIVTRCARLPLALTIAATRAARPGLSLAGVAADLADDDRLDVLSAGDPVSEVRTAFSWSYDALTPAAAELFRLLALHPDADMSVPAAASLAGAPRPRAHSLLAELTRAGLLTEQPAGRYTFHDLLRVYAAGLSRAHDPPDRRDAAVGRLLDHYLHTAHSADRLLHPHRDPIIPALDEPAPGVMTESLADPTEAMAWLTRERSALLAAIGLASDTGRDRYVWQLAWTMTTFLTRRGPWHNLTAAWHLALDAGGRLADSTMQAEAHRRLGHAYTELRRFQDADDQFRQALRLYTNTRDPLGRARTHQSLATLYERQGRPAHALDHARRAYTFYREAGHRHGQANALNHLGWCHALLDQYEQAIEHSEQALIPLQELGDGNGQADTWDTLGFAYHHLQQYDRAVTSFQNALQVYRDLGDRYREAATLVRLGDTYYTARDLVAAQSAWRDALTIFSDLDHPSVASISARLETHNTGATWVMGPV